MKKKTKKAKTKKVQKAKKPQKRINRTPTFSLSELNSYLSVKDRFADVKLNKTALIARMLRLVDLEKEVDSLREKSLQFDELSSSLKKLLQPKYETFVN